MIYKQNVLITGINGSGPSYLAEYLLEKPGLDIHGIVRWHSTSNNHKNLANIKDNVTLHECDLNDLSSVIRVIEKSMPDYIFHIAAHANVRACFDIPISVLNNNINSTINLYEAIRIVKIKPIVQLCSSSEVYGQVTENDIPIKETHKTDPPNIYAVSKLTQEKIAKAYYKSWGIYSVITRAFTYINPRRPDIFSSSFARQIVQIERGKLDKIVHGNLDSVRTLMDVRDCVNAYWLASNKCSPGEEYNIGGTHTSTVGEFLELLKKHAKCKIVSEIDSRLLRPFDITLQIPDVSKFKTATNWNQLYSLSDSVQMLLDYYRHKQ